MRNIFTAFGILFFGFFLAWIIGTSKPEPEKTTEAGPPVPRVHTLVADPQTRRILVKTHGVIEARYKIDLLSEVSGQVINVAPDFVRGGVFVPKQELIKINPINYQVALAVAKADLAKAEEVLASERARANQAEKEWRDLGQTDANALFLRKPQLATAQAQREAATAKVNKAEYDLGKTQVALDFPIRIVETYVNAGQYLSSGAKVATVYASDQLQITLALTQKQVALLNTSWPLTTESKLPDVKLISNSEQQELQWAAKIRHSSSVIDSRNQLAHIIADINMGSSASALPGLYVEAQLLGSERSNVTVVPENAFHDKRFVLVVNKEQKIEFRSAEFLARDGLQLLLDADVVAGEHVVVDRLSLAAPGMQVEAVLNVTKAPTANQLQEGQ